MLEFRPLQLEDKELVQKYLKVWNFENAELTFSNMYMWRKDSSPEICELDGFLYYKFDVKPGVPAILAPIPLDKNADFCPAMTRIEKYMKANGWEVNVRSINEEFRGLIEKCCPGRFAFFENRDFEDYVYSMEELRDLAGKRLHGKRNHIHKFLFLYEDQYTYAPLTEADVPECIALYDEWLEKKGTEPADYASERAALLEALHNLKALELRGCVIRINGTVQAFSVGVKATPELAVIHIEKANDEIEGLYPFINQQFVKNAWSDVKFINREEDMGLPGLRRAKMSYYPVRLVRKFYAKLSEL